MTEPTPSSPGQLVIRASSLPAYLDCQLRMVVHAMPWAFLQFGYRIHPPRANIGALIGSGCHGGAERGLRERMRSGTLIAASEIEDAAIEAFRARKQLEADNDTVMDGEAATMADAETQVIRMTRRYREDVVRLAKPISVESRLEAELRPGVILSGQGDLLHLDQEAEQQRLRVRDLKTSRRRSPAAKHMAQIGAYGMLYRSIGLEPQTASIDALARVHLSKPQPPVEEQPLDLPACERIAWATLNEIADKAEAFLRDGRPERFLPNPTSILCNSKFCRAHGCDVCPATRANGEA